jgi:hypothetical protein
MRKQPKTDSLLSSLPGRGDLEGQNHVVHNSQGIRVKEIKPGCNNEPVTVNTGDWPKGIYYIRMSAGGRSLRSGKVVVE